uniref:Uncharacterized protein n=1 Tax=Anguilla anguilla TaxID=7936 RepID=A0A0E9TV70_ANGAN
MVFTSFCSFVISNNRCSLVSRCPQIFCSSTRRCKVLFSI